MYRKVVAHERESRTLTDLRVKDAERFIGNAE
jgi:hypothetical protein